MKVKDLRDYLSLHDISTEVCREKEELVLLVLDQQEGRTRAPPLSPDFPEQQAFLAQPHAGTVPPTSASLPSSPTQATSVSPAPAQESQQVRAGLQPLPVSAALRAQSAPLPARRGGGVRYDQGRAFCLLRQGCFLDLRLLFGFFSEVIMHGTRYF